MLISCISCNSKYLVNSADLKPDGRTVKCVKCSKEWYQDIPEIENVRLDKTEPVAETPIPSSRTQKANLKSPTPNLPSTYVKEQKISIINSILVIFSLIILIGGFWLIKNLEINNLILLQFYIDEFTFNLNLIFNDMAKVIHRIISYLSS
tara:strand:- start:812 stop:1261 length:450 start_codon:yes stop_codon:yes gene_type:complete